MNTFWIILDVKTEKALHGIKGATLQFSSEEICDEVAKQFFNSPDDYIITSIRIKTETP